MSCKGLIHLHYHTRITYSWPKGRLRTFVSICRCMYEFFNIHTFSHINEDIYIISWAAIGLIELSKAGSGTGRFNLAWLVSACFSMTDSILSLWVGSAVHHHSVWEAAETQTRHNLTVCGCLLHCIDLPDAFIQSDLEVRGIEYLLHWGSLRQAFSLEGFEYILWVIAATELCRVQLWSQQKQIGV